ncbi:MAG: STAS domain-containing protein [Solirubrobacteraceae bacterium]
MAIARPLEIDATVQGDRATLTLTGELDIQTVPRLEEAVETALSGSPRELRIDLKPLSFLDSSGLRQFIVLYDRARREGWELALVRPAQPALSIFQITRAEENLPFIDSPPRG